MAKSFSKIAWKMSTRPRPAYTLGEIGEDQTGRIGKTCRNTKYGVEARCSTLPRLHAGDTTVGAGCDEVW